MRTYNDIRNMLTKDGINSMLIYKMTDDELKEADSYDDYYEYNRYMKFLARKYHI